MATGPNPVSVARPGVRRQAPEEGTGCSNTPVLNCAGGAPSNQCPYRDWGERRGNALSYSAVGRRASPLNGVTIESASMGLK